VFDNQFFELVSERLNLGWKYAQFLFERFEHLVVCLLYTSGVGSLRFFDFCGYGAGVIPTHEVPHSDHNTAHKTDGVRMTRNMGQMGVSESC